MAAKMNWKQEAKRFEMLYRVSQDGCHKLRLERDAAERQMREAIVRADMPKKGEVQLVVDPRHKCPAPSEHFCNEETYMRVSIILAIALALVTFVLNGVLIDFSSKFLAIKIPHETVRFDQTRNVKLVTDLLKCKDHDAAAVEAWNQDERRLKRCEP